MTTYDCFVCGKEMTHPTYRFGQTVCSKCAEKADKKYKPKKKSIGCTCCGKKRISGKYSNPYESGVVCAECYKDLMRNGP